MSAIKTADVAALDAQENSAYGFVHGQELLFLESLKAKISADLELMVLDARIAALPAYATQAGVLLHPVTPTDRQDEGAPWVGFAADIRGRA